MRAQMIMLSVAVLLFFPALGSGTLFGQPVVGLVAPVGISVVFGAFIFGIGMQLGGGCASGTLFTVGGGNARMLVTLFFFICGSVIATQTLDDGGGGQRRQGKPPVGVMGRDDRATDVDVP